MPARPKRPCPACPNLTTDRYCEICKASGKGKDDRRNSTQRGYDSVWQRFRRWFIVRHPLCADCQRAITTDVHHIKKLCDFPELRLVESNCLGLCGTCHKVRTARGE